MAIRRFVVNQALKRVSGGKFNRPGRVQALTRLPFLLRLAYPIFRDSRVPLSLRVGVLALLGLIFSPLDFVGDIPIVGQFWDFTLAVVVLEAFLQWAPAEVVNEHVRRLGLESRFTLRPE
jgi:uncharacterized membrane protein YkvA (DUF1232 family)